MAGLIKNTVKLSILKKYFLSIFIVGFFFFQNIFWQFVSHIYLSSVNIYITEQNKYSHYNNAYIIDIFVLALALVVCIALLIFLNNDITNILAEKLKAPERSLNGKIIFVVVILEILLFFNLLISDIPPLLQGGYINRIGYLEETKLWPVLRIFGSVAVLVPIILGYLFGQNKLTSSKNKINYVLLLLYIIYLLLIGQKFSGIFIAIFFLILPITLIKICSGEKIFKKEHLFYCFIVAMLFTFFLAYHYSTNPLAEQMGGAFLFILYRALALQGHLSWGYFNNYDCLTLNPDFLFNSMQKMMKVVGDPSVVSSMIDRGVNMTGAFPFNFMLSFPFLLGSVLFCFICLLFYLHCLTLIRFINRIYYLPVAYLLVSWINFFTRGGIEQIVDAKNIFIFVTALVFGVFNESIKKNKNINSRTF